MKLMLILKEDQKEFIKSNKLTLKTQQQRFRSERHNVYTR